MTILARTCILAALLLVTGPQILAQQVINFSVSGCEEIHKTFGPVNPRRSADELILPGQMVMQLNLSLNKDARIVVTEYPDSTGDDDSYNSEITVHRVEGSKIYRMARLFDHGNKNKGFPDIGGAFRIDEIASVCTAPNEGRVILAFETVGSQTSQAFVLVQYSPTSITVEPFPVVTLQGSLTMSHSEPAKAELWSATKPGPGIDCTACSKYYAVQDCRIAGTSIKCAVLPGLVGPLSPTKFEEHRIEIRESHPE